MDNKYDIFISYSRRDSELVLTVVKQLQKRGFAIWIDKDGIESGDAFKSVIVRAIKNSDVFLFFSSKGSNESPWTVKEVNTAVHLKKTIIPVRLDDTDYNDSILFDLVGLDFVDLVDEEKRSSALDKLINTLLSKIAPVNLNDIDSKITPPKTLSNVEGFEVGYDLTVYVIHKLRGQTLPKDDAIIEKKLSLLGINPNLLLANLNAETMSPQLSECAIKLGRLYGKQIENSVCLGSLLVLSVIAKRSNISDEFGHSYDKGIIDACSQLGIANAFVDRLINGNDDEMESMMEELKNLLTINLLDNVQESLPIEDCYNNGVSCYESENYTEAADWFMKAANKGHASSQCHLGYLYAHGLGIRTSDEEAANWYKKAAEQGDSLAQNNLGSMYREGRGVHKNVEEAARWFRIAASQGSMLAQYNLAIMYLTGSGVPQDEAEAVKWYRAAAEQGLPQAQLSLGNMYRTGSGVKEKDESEAFKWFKKAAEQGLADAQHNLGYMYYNGCGTRRDIDEAVNWLKKAAAQGHSGAKSALKMIMDSLQ